MKYLIFLTALLIAIPAFSKSTALHYDFFTGFYTLEHEVKPKRFVGVMYQNIDFSDDGYNYNGNAYGLSLSMKELIDSSSINLFLTRADIDRNLCSSCAKENLKSYIWGGSAAYNWVWDWGLYIHFGVGIYLQHKTYSYRDSSFKGPMFYFPLGLGFAF